MVFVDYEHMRPQAVQCSSVRRYRPETPFIVGVCDTVSVGFDNLGKTFAIPCKVLRHGFSRVEYDLRLVACRCRAEYFRRACAVKVQANVSVGGGFFAFALLPCHFDVCPPEPAFVVILSHPTKQNSESKGLEIL